MAGSATEASMKTFKVFFDVRCAIVLKAFDKEHATDIIEGMFRERDNAFTGDMLDLCEESYM